MVDKKIRTLERLLAAQAVKVKKETERNGSALYDSPELIESLRRYYVLDHKYTKITGHHYIPRADMIYMGGTT